MRILLIEDNPGDARLISLLLQEGNLPYELECATRLSSAIRLTKTKFFDVILLDLSLPDSEGKSTFLKIHALKGDTPIIVLTGQLNEGLGAQLVHAGAQDFLFKGNLDVNFLTRSIRYAIERKKAEDRLDSFFDISLDLLCIASSDGYFKRINPAFTHTLGWSEEEFLSQPFVNFVHPEDRQATLDAGEKLAKGQFVSNFQNRYRCKNGTWRWLEWEAAPKPDSLIYASARDISDTKQLIADLTQSKTDAEQATRAKSAFLATMSHEIRTPLNGVIGMTNVLSHSGLSRHQADMVETIEESAKVLLGIIDDILDFSKIEAGRLEFEPAPVSMVDLVEGLCNSLTPIATRKDVIVTTFISPRIPEKVLVDETRLRQILYNMVGNAIKFSAGKLGNKGRVAIRVDLNETDTPQLVIKVADNGIGMRPETIANLFTPFTQGESSTTRRFGGTGLGLAICKRLIDLMQGTIEVKSELNEGSAFTLAIPINIPADQPPFSTPDLTGINCLIINSRDIDFYGLGTYLESSGAQVQIVNDIPTAIEVGAGLGNAFVLIQDAGQEKASMSMLRMPFDSMLHVRHLCITRGKRKSARMYGHDLICIDAESLRKKGFLQAVSVLGEKTSSEAFRNQYEDTVPVRELSTPPNIGEARDLGKLILIAEDDEINQKVILQQLGLLGYAAEVANNGLEALQMWREGRYALLLTDLYMPEMDGFVLTEEIRREEKADSRIPILVITASALREEANLAIATGCNEYLTKPVQLEVLESAIKRWLPQTVFNQFSVQSTSQATDCTKNSVIDLSILERLVGQDISVIHELLLDYRDVALRSVESLHAALRTDDIRGIGMIAHKLKSSSRSVGALQLGDICADLDSASRAGDRGLIAIDIEKLEIHQKQVNAEIKRILTAME